MSDDELRTNTDILNENTINFVGFSSAVLRVVCLLVELERPLGIGKLYSVEFVDFRNKGTFRESS